MIQAAGGGRIRQIIRHDEFGHRFESVLPDNPATQDEELFKAWLHVSGCPCE
jgi:hypothetical protein